MANPDVEIVAALRPAMATVPGAVLLGISSPYARRGILWQQYTGIMATTRPHPWCGKPRPWP